MGKKKGYGGEFNYKIVMYTVCAIYNPTTCRGENKEVYKIKKKKHNFFFLSNIRN
jgi:hypothetical protein